ncbi:antibiotic biosynthesis monooxygenase [Gluconobacter sp. OJB]|uniref:putative quinol monooxygenase n=1 Tax=Gluconobacter sp. OJB TaxID=3145196 RepID=UPI0031F94493
MLIVTGTLSVVPSDLTNFMADLGPLAEATRRRDGSLFYHTAVLDARTGQLLVVERWRDEAALAAYLRSADTIAFLASWQGRLKSGIRVYDAENERPIATE